MKGSDYVVTDKSDLTNKAGEILVRKGESCESLPETSLPWLLEQGYITPKPIPVTDEDRARKRRKAVPVEVETPKFLEGSADTTGKEE